MFKALSQGNSGSERHHHDFRRVIVGRIEEDWNAPAPEAARQEITVGEWASVLQSKRDLSKETYKTMMMDDKTYGTLLEVEYASDLQDGGVSVYRKFKDAVPYKDGSIELEHTSGPFMARISLLFTGSMNSGHYELLKIVNMVRFVVVGRDGERWGYLRGVGRDGATNTGCGIACNGYAEKVLQSMSEWSRLQAPPAFTGGGTSGVRLLIQGNRLFPKAA